MSNESNERYESYGSHLPIKVKGFSWHKPISLKLYLAQVAKQIKDFKALYPNEMTYNDQLGQTGELLENIKKMESLCEGRMLRATRTAEKLPPYLEIRNDRIIPVYNTLQLIRHELKCYLRVAPGGRKELQRLIDKSNHIMSLVED